MTTTPEKGISRRSVLKRSAAAGAAFWAVPIIDTVLARPADASAVPCLTFNGSWMYVVWTFGGAVNFTGYKKGDSGSACNTSSNPKGAKTISCGGVFYTLKKFTGTPGNGTVTYGPTSPGTNSATFVGAPNCSTFLTLSGGQVSPAQAGVTILASFCFGAGSLKAACAVAGTSCANCD